MFEGVFSTRGSISLMFAGGMSREVARWEEQCRSGSRELESRKQRTLYLPVRVFEEMRVVCVLSVGGEEASEPSILVASKL